MRRGPVIATVTNPAQRNAIGTHAGSYSVYRALAVAAGALDPLRKPDLTNTAPAEPIGPHPQWSDPQRIVSIDPFGAMVSEAFALVLRPGLRHPAHHRGHQGAHPAARAGRARSRPAA